MSQASKVERRRPGGDRLITALVNFVPNVFDRALHRLGTVHLFWLILLLLLLGLPLIITPLAIWQQGLVAVVLLVVGWIVVQVEQRYGDRGTSEYLHLFMVVLSLITTLRYLFYRVRYTVNLDGWVDSFFSILLLLAELYAIMTLGLAYFQTLKLKDRKPVDLHLRPQEQWFSVDVYIPTYNEDVEIVRKTALGALAIDYPADKKHVYILDDGRAEKYRARRQQLRQMCEELGCTLMTRDNNDHAKAGNINTAMRKTQGDLILILDCDHIPSRDILQNTVGFFYKPQVSMVQTPHWFYNPDPFERNLLTEGKIPVGNELFYKVLQKGNDFWNAAFFCGSAAVIRKDYVLEIGGIATETVTEDCHTSFRLHALGYETVYYDKIMVAGLAPEKFSSYVGQQVRWARGMAQILRLENPLFNRKRKLTLAQRLCYFSATSHFFFGFPRLMYAIAPVLFLLFGINSVRGLGLETIAYAAPHILLATYTNHITYKSVRFSFWNELYEFALSFQAGIVTLLALINPKLGKFNVTDKGASVTRRQFDWESARALLIVVLITVPALVAVPFWLLLRPTDTEAILINAFWCGFNLVLLFSALLVAFEQPQLRRSHRLARELTAVIYSADQTWTGKTENISETGCQLVLDTWANLPDEIELELIGDYGARAFVNARIIRITPLDDSQVTLAIDFIDPSRTQLDALAIVIYSDVREWYSQQRQVVDDPMQSFRFIAGSLSRSLRDPQPADSTVRIRKQIRAAAQLYWKGQLYSGTATEISSRSIRVQLDANPQLDSLEQGKAIVGLLLSQDAREPLPQRLLTQVESIEYLSEAEHSQVAIELRFPNKLRDRQAAKIKQLVSTLT
ncbi:UDP-forming cellulose synthase catalytic subunit [Leptolyngbya sp. FACHB-36]|uniref:UDP-forming cellulose synthase catalytic subunit n=1 Tax=Leptolyngbya sp. FACHB-36 TaxID=2692808 RepID=UPI0016805D53|nr:UDP-forming cellulose synthase catalytic subunit [Leptolyngbya sp. FACHB-36]MBD2019118.1 UDP-forming cellulose synthase catalytic subunit [Leptolyngbya sp. FACHB-36]